MVAWDAVGQCLFKLQCHMIGNVEPLNVAALGALLVVHIDVSHGWREVIFQGDCLNIIFDINNQHEVDPIMLIS